MAKAFLAILSQASDLRLLCADPEHDLLDFLSKPHTDRDLVRATQEVLKELGGTQ